LPLACLLILSGVTSAQEEKRIDETKESPSRALDTFKLPAGAIIVIGKELGDASGVILTKERYNELMERIEKLERMLQPGKPQPPSTCKIRGQIEGDRVHFRILYEFVTTQARTTVALGAQRSWPVEAKMDDGELPLLLSAGEGAAASSGEGGLVVRVEKPGKYTLTLDVEMLAESKGDDRSVNLGLPRAAITSLEELTVPAAVSQIRLNSDPSPGPFGGWKPPLQPLRSGAPQPPGRWVKTEAHDAEHRRLSAVPLGAVEHLELTWKGPVGNAANSEPLLTAEGRRWDVHVDETGVLSEVTLILQARRGRSKRWQLQLPSQAQVEVKEPTDADERIQKIEMTPQPAKSASGADGAGTGPTLTIELKEPSAEPLRVVLQVRQSWSEGRVSIGPYFVKGAFRQWGIIRVTESADLRLRYHPRSDVNRRETRSEQTGDNYVAEFAYWTPPASAAEPSQTATSTAPLVLEVVKGTVEAHVEHELRWTSGGNRAGEASPKGWQAVSKIRVTPQRTSVDRVEMRIPPDYAYDKEVGASSNNAVIDEVVVDAGNGLATIKVQKQSRPFTVRLPAFYPVAEGAQQATLELPRPMQSLDRGGQITAILPAEGWEFVPREEVPAGEHEHTWQFDRAPTHIELAWRSFRPELGVHSLVDATLVGSKGRVRQELKIESPPTPMAIHLQIPAALTGSLLVTQGGTLNPNSQEVALTKSEEKTHVLVLEYSFPLEQPANNQKAIDIPFVKVAEATRTENKVRVWTEPGIVPVVDQAFWEEMPAEVVAGKDSLPSLVERSASMDNPLQISLRELPGVRPVSTIIERAFNQVGVGDHGQTYRARFLLTQFQDRRLEVGLPYTIAKLNVTARVNGQRIQHELRDEHHFWVQLEPSAYSKPLVIEIRYRIPSELLSEHGAWQTRLTPPEFPSNVFVDRVRWQVDCPAGWVPLLPGLGQSWDAKWEWQGGLLTPRPAFSNADLEAWLQPGPADSRSGAAESPGELMTGMTCDHASLASLNIVQVWQPIWLLLCSLIFVGLSLGLVIAATSSRNHGLLWLATGGLGLIALIGAVFWPGMTSVIIYGCEPGLVVVVALLSVQWWVQQRYRRRVVFLPGFTRLKTGSSIIRTGASARPPEPTTAPARPSNEKPESRNQKSTKGN
jgi:hypothetical protein